MKINIRTMLLSDYAQVYALWLSCKGMGLNDLDDSQEGIARYLNRNSDTCYVAERGEEIVGAILAGHDGRRGFIYHLAVSSACRHQGIGSELVTAALAALKACGIHKTALVVFSHNQEGNAFWEKQGFTQRGDLTYRNRALSELKRTDT